MAWHLHAVQLEDGRWSCRHGRHEFDLHGDLVDCIQHLRLVAESIGPSELFMHPYGAETSRIDDL